LAFIRRKREEPRIELTPMVDVVFLLLIFFMISTTFIDTPGIAVKLPESSAPSLSKTPEEVEVVLSREGEIYLQGTALSPAQLAEQLRSYHEQAAETTFMLRADEQALHGRVVQVMDIAREAGFGRLAMATEKGQGR
jgi:biopolymer transport protein ExbD/biopolymer transport protein TolR